MGFALLAFLQVEKLLAALLVPAAQDQRGIDAAESKGIRQTNVEAVGDGLIGHIIQVALGIHVFQVDGRRQHLTLERQHGDAGFQSASAAQQVAMHGLGARDFELVAQGVLAEDRLDGLRFIAVAGRSCGGVGVDVAHLFRSDAGVLESGLMLRCAPRPSGAMLVM